MLAAGALDDGHIAINDMSGISPDMAPAAWDAYHRDVLRRLRPGIPMLIVHLGEDPRPERESFAEHDGGWGPTGARATCARCRTRSSGVSHRPKGYIW